MSTATTPGTGVLPLDPYRVRAMEIWSGTETESAHLSTYGFDAWMYSAAHAGNARGGDLRFVSTCAMGQIVRFTLCDLAGHGAAAEQTASRLRALLRKHINTPNPTRFALALNKEFAALAAGGEFATAIITTYFAPTDALIVCNAGHPRPLLRHARDGSWEYFHEGSACVLAADQARQTGIANLPLGVMHPTEYPQFATRLAPDDVMLLYTDALLESRAPDGRMLGEDGLLALVRGIGPAEPAALGPAILRALDDWRGGRPADDDQTLIVLHHTATNPPDGVWPRIKALARVVGVMR